MPEGCLAIGISGLVFSLERLRNLDTAAVLKTLNCIMLFASKAKSVVANLDLAVYCKKAAIRTSLSY